MRKNKSASALFSSRQAWSPPTEIRFFFGLQPLEKSIGLLRAVVKLLPVQRDKRKHEEPEAHSCLTYRRAESEGHWALELDAKNE